MDADAAELWSRARAELKITDTALASLLDRTRAEVVRWETGQEATPGPVRDRLEAVLDPRSPLRGAVVDHPGATRVRPIETWMLPILGLVALLAVAFAGSAFVGLLSAEAGPLALVLFAALLTILVVGVVKAAAGSRRLVCSLCGAPASPDRRVCLSCDAEFADV